MTDRIPITTQIALPIIEFVCAKGACNSLPETLHLEEYGDSELSFERGEAKDGTILIKADGRDAFELKEEGTILNLQYQQKVNVCARYQQCNSLTDSNGKIVEENCFEPPQPACDNPIKMVIAALFGEEELKTTSLTQDEKQRVRKLKQAMGLDSPGSEKKEIPSLEIERVPPKGSFFSDRWKGWRFGGEGFFNYSQGPGGGSKIWIGYRQDRWDFRVAGQGEGIKLREDNYDVRLGISLDPVFHLLSHPFVLDPYINLPEIGFYHLFPVGPNRLNQEASGISFSPLGAGLQIHLNDDWSLYAGAKLRAAFTFEEKAKLGAEVPLGFSGHY